MAVIDWARYVRTTEGPLRQFLIAIPNGTYLGGTKGQRAAQMARLKRVGLRPGAHDLLLALGRHIWHGFWIEMKKPRQAFRGPADVESAVSEEQVEFARDMERARYLCMVAYGFAEAQKYIQVYLAGADPRELAA